MARITGVRRQLSKELGFVVPQAQGPRRHQSGPFNYRILINGVVAAEDQVSPDEMLALDTGQAFGTLDGKPVKDPTFGLPATWILKGDADAATGMGYPGRRSGHRHGDPSEPYSGLQRRRAARPDEGPVAARRAEGTRSQLAASLSPNPCRSPP
jgi:flagellar biosynthesis protein FlhA